MGICRTTVARPIDRLTGSLAVALMLLIMLGGTDARAACATEPPPEGLVERCQGKDYVVSDAMSEEQLRAAVNSTLVEWMRGCVIANRAPGLVDDAEESVDKMVALMLDLPSHRRSVRIIPDYVPLTYHEGGKTCYGVESVTFHIAGAQGEVEEPEDSEIGFEPTSSPPSDLVKEAAKAAIEALKDPSVPGSAELSRFQSVLIELEKYGSDFDDTWFNVQPQGATACYKNESGGCLKSDEALKACTQHLGPRLVQSHHYDEVSQKRYAEILQVIANDIQRSMDYLQYLQGNQEGAEVPGGGIECESLEKVFMPRIGELAGKHSIYGAGQY